MCLFTAMLAGESKISNDTHSKFIQLDCTTYHRFLQGNNKKKVPSEGSTFLYTLW